MGDKLKNLIIFAGGLAVGSIATYAILKTRYDQILNEEIEEDYYRDDDIFEEEWEEQIDEESEKEEYKEATQMYTNYVKPDLKTLVNNDVKEEPYIIEPEEFGEMNGYELINLTYYADKFLADDMDELVDNVNEVIGWENLDHMGEYEEDALHIRNDRLKVDYEILQVTDNYKDIKEGE